MMMPHLMNCPHSESGWCLGCVKAAHDMFEVQIENLSQEIIAKADIIGALRALLRRYTANEWHKVENSSNVLGYAYDPDSSELTVEFSGGSQYAYADVPQQAFDNLLMAESKGSFISKQIKPYHEVRKLTT